MYLEDIHDNPDFPDGHHDSTTFCLMILKILKPSRTSPYWEDIPDIPDGHHDVWHHYHSTTFHMRIPKIYDTWVFVAIKAIKNITILGGHS